jgi:hypothetical protein
MRVFVAGASGAIATRLAEAGLKADSGPSSDAQLHVCLGCGSPLVQPVAWLPLGPERWRILLRCPDCELLRDDVFNQQAIDDYDRELDRGTAVLTRQYEQMVEANLATEAERLAAALAVDALLPEDF